MEPLAPRNRRDSTPWDCSRDARARRARIFMGCRTECEEEWEKTALEWLRAERFPAATQ